MEVDNSKVPETDNQLDIGALLVEARNNANFTSLDIADALNLNPDIISKIEVNTFEQELPMAFIRGYVKSYATKVGLESQPILAAFDKVTGIQSPSLKRVESISSFGIKKRDFNSNSSLFKFISILIVLLFVTFAGWQIWDRYLAPLYMGTTSQNSDLNANNLSLSLGDDVAEDIVLPDMSKQEAVKNSAIEENDSSIQEIAKINGKTNIESANGVSQESSEQIAIDQESNLISEHVFSDIILDFSADCWVRITDARGEVLAVGVKGDGKHMPMRGVAPITVILGDPSAVSMSFQDQTFDLSGYRAGRRVQIVLE